MTLVRIRTSTGTKTGNKLTACPLCGHEFGHMEPRWKHLLDEHGPEDAGLSPVGEQGDSGQPLFDPVAQIPGGGSE